MDDSVSVEVVQGQGCVMGEVDLQVVGQRLLGVLKEVSEAFVHELHEEGREARLAVRARAQVLHYIGVPDTTEELALLLEALLNASCPRVPVLKEDWVEELGCTR